MASFIIKGGCSPCLLACSANVLVSSDDDLLTLHPYGDILVLTPKAYLADS